MLTSTLNVGSIHDGGRLSINIYKNGVLYAGGVSIRQGNLAGQTVSVSSIVEANGITDYFEIFVRSDSTESSLVCYNSVETHFSGTLVSH